MLSTLFAEAGLYLGPGLMICLVWLASLSGAHPSPTPELWGYTQASTATWIFCAAEDVTSSPHTCRANASPTKPSPQNPILIKQVTAQSDGDNIINV